jgi:DNA modification methylase
VPFLPYYHNEEYGITLYRGDCLKVLNQLKAESIDAIVTDPPAGISFMGKKWDHDKGGRKQWIAWMTEIAEQCMRVVKPGAHALVWALPRTSHWTATAWEDAEFECRDRVVHCFSTGFPKSLNVSVAMDRAAGAEREITYQGPELTTGGVYGENINAGFQQRTITKPTTDEAKQWDGYGTALKPAVEDYWLFRKPLSEKTIVANVLKHGTGALNIDACRVPCENNPSIERRKGKHSGHPGEYSESHIVSRITPERYAEQRVGEKLGRFPANIVTDGSSEVLELFPESKSTGGQASLGAFRNGDVYGKGKDIRENRDPGFGDNGSAARFFYCTKASKKDRGEGNNHPTCKSTRLMEWLCRMISPPNSLCCDPFLGSASTAIACIRSGVRFVGIEKEEEYLQIAVRRIENEIAERAKV